MRMLSASSFKASSSKIRRGLVLDSVSMERGRSRYSAAGVMVVLMVMAPFERWHCKKVVERTRFSVSAPLRRRFRRVGSAAAAQRRRHAVFAGSLK